MNIRENKFHESYVDWRITSQTVQSRCVLVNKLARMCFLMDPNVSDVLCDYSYNRFHSRVSASSCDRA